MGKIPGGQAKRISAKIQEITRQAFHQMEGYPHDPDDLETALQAIIEGKFATVQKQNGSARQLRDGGVLTVINFDGNPDFGKITETAGKRTKDCFSNDERFDRDPSIDAWLGPSQYPGEEGAYSVLELCKPATFAKMFAEALAPRIIGADDVEAISKPLIRRMLTWELQEIEDLVARQEAGEEVGIQLGGEYNFFPVNDHETVYVIILCLEGKVWDVDIMRLSEDRRFDAGSRLFLPAV